MLRNENHVWPFFFLDCRRGGGTDDQAAEAATEAAVAATAAASRSPAVFSHSDRSNQRRKEERDLGREGGGRSLSKVPRVSFVTKEIECPMFILK